jgi:hypothetical protein
MISVFYLFLDFWCSAQFWDVVTINGEFRLLFSIRRIPRIVLNPKSICPRVSGETSRSSICKTFVETTFGRD